MNNYYRLKDCYTVSWNRLRVILFFLIATLSGCAALVRMLS